MPHELVKRASTQVADPLREEPIGQNDATIGQLRQEIDLLKKRIAALENAGYRRQWGSWREKFRPKLWTFYQYEGRVLKTPPDYSLQILPANLPRIAIVTPSFNHAPFIADTINSVLDQNYPNLDYIVQDGNSRDGTTRILESFGDRLAWRSEPDDGQTDAINRGFAVVSGDIMAYLNSDDMLMPGTLAYVAKVFQQRSDIDFVYGHRIFIDATGHEVGRAVLPKHDNEALKWADYVPQETMFWRRSVWDKIRPFDVSFQSAMDWDFILRAQSMGFRFARLPRFLGCFRVHPDQKTTAMNEVSQAEQERLRLRHIGYQPSGRTIERAIRGYLRRHVLYHRLYKLKLLKT